jgi:hypothetical protein
MPYQEQLSRKLRLNRLLDQIMMNLAGPTDFNDLFRGLKKALLKRALGSDLAHHLGCSVPVSTPMTSFTTTAYTGVLTSFL